LQSKYSEIKKELDDKESEIQKVRSSKEDKQEALENITRRCEAMKKQSDN